MPVAEINGVAFILLTAGIRILHGGINDGAGGVETDVDEKAIEFPGIAHKALFGVVEDIGGHKLEPSRGAREIGLVGGDTRENAAIVHEVKSVGMMQEGGVEVATMVCVLYS